MKPRQEMLNEAEKILKLEYLGQELSVYLEWKMIYFPLKKRLQNRND